MLKRVVTVRDDVEDVLIDTSGIGRSVFPAKIRRISLNGFDELQARGSEAAAMGGQSKDCAWSVSLAAGVRERSRYTQNSVTPPNASK
jgi:hypothetical protein